MNETDLDTLMSLALVLPDSPRKVELLEEAVRIADAHHDELTAMHVRLQLLDAATFGGKIERSIVAFGWILGYYDKNPDCIDLHTLLWRYKWIVANVVGFTTVGKQRIYEMEEDIERRFLENGFSLQVVHEKRFENAKWMGDRERAKTYFEKWLQSERDSLSDCLACDQNHRVEAFAYFGQLHEALEAAEPLLQGRMSCRTMPQVTYAMLILPAIELQNADLAEQLFKDGYHQIQGKDNFLREAAQHLYYLVWTNRLDEAVDCFWEHLPISRNLMVDSHNLQFQHAASCLFQALGTSNVQVRQATLLTEELSNKNSVPATELLDMSQKEVDRLTKAFDKRNENDYWSNRIAKVSNLVLAKH